MPARWNADVQPGDLVVLVQHGPEVLYSFWGRCCSARFLDHALPDPSSIPNVTTTACQLVALSEVKAVITYPDMEPSAPT